MPIYHIKHNNYQEVGYNKYMRKTLGVVCGVVVIFLAFVWLFVSPSNKVYAGVIMDRNLTLSSTNAGAINVDYSFSFDVPSSTTIKSFKAEICTTASGICTTPTGFNGSSANLIGNPSGFGDASGWTDESVAGSLRIKNNANASSPGATQAVAFGGVTNPSSMATSFFVRVYTYSDDTYATLIDEGSVVSPVGEDTILNVNIDEVMSFCIYTGINCASGGYLVALGTPSISSTAYGTSKMDVATNAGSGFNITVLGNTLTSTTDTIASLGLQTASSVGSSQFGINLVDNVNPDIGSFRAGDANASPTADYDDIDLFKFVSGEAIASASQPTNTSTFTISYIANVAPDTDAGSYATTLTYNCTATF